MIRNKLSANQYLAQILDHYFEISCYLNWRCLENITNSLIRSFHARTKENLREIER